jgi:nucleotide-binding universal stress UspA family protein
LRHGEEPGADIVCYLAQHGAHVAVEQLSSHGSPIAEIIVSHAMTHGVDLIVIGAYGRARSWRLVA